MTGENKGNRIAHYVSNYTVFDLETTGMSAVNDAIIEISAVKVRDGEVTETFSTLVNPNRKIPYYATAVNGITDDMVCDAPCIEEALADFLTFVGEDILVGHNIQSFDLKFIYHAAMELFGREVPNDYIDTLYMARNCLKELKHHKLVDIAEHFQISSEGAHRALNDCIMNQKCFEEMARLAVPEKIELCPRCGKELKKRNGRFGEFIGCSNFPKCRYTRNV